ncbi:MAG: peptidylprolyl isomerase [Actinomycetota bacterium]|nr:peptidylprolyl isomerase [Actinomycetota bacterium]
MPNRKTRERQLAKLAARRAAERRRQRRQRITAIVVALAVTLGAGAFVFVAFTGSDQKPSAKSSSSATPSAQLGTPKQTGTIKPTVTPPKQVACGGSVPKDAGKPKPQFSPAPDPASTIDANKRYVASVKTSCGTFQLELYPKQAPDAVASFVFLAKHGFFDGLTFHRIVKSFALQGGDPKGDGTGGPGYAFPTETDPSLQFGKPGVLAMANSGPDTNGSQWFVTLGPDTNLNPSGGANYTIFGKVIKGMSTIDKIANVPTTASGSGENSQPTQAVYIDSVRVQEK